MRSVGLSIVMASILSVIATLEPEDSSADPSGDPSPLVRVIVEAPNFSYVQVRIDGKTLTLGRSRRTRDDLLLRAATHPVDYRTWPGSAWRRAGVIELHPYQPATLRLDPDGSLELRE